MNGSFQLGTAFGIPIRMHWSFPLVLLVFVPDGLARGLLWAMTLFGCVLLHELGHSLTARAFGIRVVDITFWPLGGMARMSAMPESPRVEGLIAIAGPAVNFVLVALGIIGFLLSSQVFLPDSAITEYLFYFILTNLLLGTFNLLPAFPMDGGRILRSWFARRNDWVVATERAVSVGRFLAAGMLILSVVLMFNSPQMVCAMPLIALFVYIAGGQELAMVRVRHGIPPFGTSFAGSMFGGGPAGPRAGAPRDPSWSEPPRTERPPGKPSPAAAEDSGPQGARRPATWEPVDEPPSGGFDEEAIRRLERYRGRLRRPDED